MTDGIDVCVTVNFELASISVQDLKKGSTATSNGRFVTHVCKLNAQKVTSSSVLPKQREFVLTG